jgi:hypothetical protein
VYFCNPSGTWNNLISGTNGLTLTAGGSNNLSAGIAACNTATIAANGGSSDSCYGHAAGAGLTSGQADTVVGDSAGATISTTSLNSFFGWQAGALTNGSDNTAVGANAFAAACTAGAPQCTDNTAVGHQALVNETSGHANTAVGKDAGNGVTTGSFNTFIGQDAAVGLGGPGCSAGSTTSITGTDNTFIGQGSGCNGSGALSDNTFVGFQAAGNTPAVVTGNQNTFVGSLAGHTSGVTGTGNVILGYNSNIDTAARNGAIVLGANATSPAADNSIIIGDSSHSNISIGGNYVFSKPSTTVILGNAIGDASATFQTGVLQTGADVAMFNPHLEVSTSGDIAFSTSASSTGARDVNFSRVGTNTVGVGNGTVGNSSGFIASGNKVFLNSPFTDANAGGLQVITGLSYALGTVARNWSFHCSWTYSQATPSASDQFGVASLTTSPTNLHAWAHVVTTEGAAAVQTTGDSGNITNTTPTAIVTFTPVGTGVKEVEIDGSIETAGTTATTLQFYVTNGTAANVIVIARDSYCALF